MSARTSVVANFRIDDCTYGDATDTIRRVIRRAEHHQWFPEVTVDDSVTAAIRDRLTHHFEMMGETVMARSLSVDFIQGRWNVLAETYRAVNPVADDPAYGRGRWRDMLAVVAGEMRRDLERARREAIVPPLFPVVGNAGIVGGMLATEIGGANVVNDERYRQTVWYAMCDVDSDFWSAMTWALAREDRRDENPFEELLEMYASGFYPLGFIGERFIVYSYALSPPARSQG